MSVNSPGLRTGLLTDARRRRTPSIVAEAMAPGISHRGNRLLLLSLSRILPTLGAQAEKGYRFVVKTLALVFIPQRYAHDAPDHARTKIVRIVEAVYSGHHFFSGQVRVLDVGKLVA